MSSESWQLIYAAVRRIPRGRVSSYGRIGRLLGQPRWARLVGYAMAACQDPSVPCHRVLRHDGQLAAGFGPLGPQLQQALLENEGVEVREGRVDMDKYAWPD